MAPEQLGPIRRRFAPWNDPSAKPYIRFKGVTKRFGDAVAVDNLSLDIYEREFFALLGPSGCGKTTLMRMIAGFEKPDEGTIELDGQVLNDVPPHKRLTNMMFQSYALFPHMTVADNIAFGLKQDGVEKGERDERVNEMLKLVQMEPFAKRRPHQMSGGQRQRVALARALAKRPKVLLLDEPLGALDKKLREETQLELTTLQERLKMTFLIVTHDQEEAMTVADRIAVMSTGTIAQVATPAEIYEQPNSRYVADFIGDINLMAGAVTADGFKPDGLEGVTLQLASAPDNVSGGKGWFAMRPEKADISLEPPGDTGDLNVLSGIVWEIAYLGDMSIYHIKLDNGTVLRASQTNRGRHVERQIEWDDRVWITFAPDAGLVLTS